MEKTPPKAGYFSKIAEIFRSVLTDYLIFSVTTEAKDSFEFLQYFGYITLMVWQPQKTNFALQKKVSKFIVSGFMLN